MTRETYQTRTKDRFGHEHWKSYGAHYFIAGERAPASFDCTCGRREVFWRDVEGKYKAEEKCGAKCQASKGPSCECSCGGMNHGKSWG